MQLFLVWFLQPIPFWVSTAIVVLMIWIMLRSVLTSEGGGRWAGWARKITNPNAKFLFTFLFIVWLVVFGVTLQIVPHVGASSPYGAIGLIALYTGFFIMMGLIWAVVGE